MAESSRERMITTASDLFYAHGFHATGLDRIIAEVGVTKTTFYNHFESKDALIIAVLEERDRRETAEWMARIRDTAGPDPRAQLLAFFDLLEEWFARPDFRGCMFMKAMAEFPAPNEPIHRAAAAHGQALLVEMRDRAARAGAKDPESLARQLMMVLSGAIVAAHGGGGEDSAQTARLAAELLIERRLPEGVAV